jgi:hypothetical protein
VTEPSARSREVATWVVALCAVPGLVHAALSLYAEAFDVFTPTGEPWQQFFGGAVLAVVWMATLALAPAGAVVLAVSAVRRQVSIARAAALALLLAPSLWAFLDLVSPLLSAARP